MGLLRPYAPRNDKWLDFLRIHHNMKLKKQKEVENFFLIFTRLSGKNKRKLYVPKEDGVRR